MNVSLTYFDRGGHYFGESQGWQSAATELEDVLDEVRRLRCDRVLPGLPGNDVYVLVAIAGEKPRLVI